MNFCRSITGVLHDLSTDHNGNKPISKHRIAAPTKSLFSWSSFSYTKPLNRFEDKNEFKMWIEEGNWILDGTRVRRQDTRVEMRYVCKTSRYQRRCKCDAEIWIMKDKKDYTVYGNDQHSSHKRERSYQASIIDTEIFEAVLELKDGDPDLENIEIVDKLKCRFPLIKPSTVKRILKRFRKEFYASSGYNYVWW